MTEPAALAAYAVSLMDLLAAKKRESFLDWLRAHSQQAVDGSERKVLRESLTAWFSLLSEPDLISEYRLVLGEILWWYERKEEKCFDDVSHGDNAKPPAD
jgi:hypothetical protein